MRRILPLVLAASALAPVLTAGDATMPPPAVPAGTTAPAPTPAPAPAAETKPTPTVPTPTPAAEVKPVEPVPAVTAPPIDADLPEGAFVATIKSNSFVRFGPNRSAKPALCTRTSGPIVVLGPARGAPDWLLVRLPREASVWMHRKVLTAQDGGKTFVVNEDRAKARDDATLGGNIVCEVEKGEIVEAKGRQVGDWHAVVVPSATAYVHRNVLMDNPQLAALPKAQPVDRRFADQLWEVAQKRYDAYQAALQKDLEVAAILDWSYLSQQLGEVVVKHPDSQVQAAAQRMRDAIAKVVKAVVDIQGKHNVTPQRDVPGQAPIPEPKPVEEPTKPADTTPVTVAVGAKPKVDTKTIPTSIPEVVKPKPQFPVEGMLMEQAYPGVGVNHVIVDSNQNVLAFIKVKDGGAVQLNEYFWRFVGVKGEKVAVDPAKHKLGKDVPLFLVEDLVLIKQ